MAFRKTSIAVLLASTAITAVIADQANAQTAAAPTAAAPTGTDNSGVETITVTATKFAANVQNVPISMTAITGEQINAGRIGTMESLNNLAPNLQVMRNVNTSNAYIVYIRGQGRNNSLFNVEPEVALYIDDVYYPYQVGPVTDLDDINHVEVLNGPQGTLYGRNATVGAIRYVTNHPDLHDTTAYADFTTGSYGRAEGQGGISAPLIDGTLAGSIAFGVHSYDGFMTDLATGEKVGGDHTEEARAQLLWQAAPNLQVFFSMDGLHANDPIDISTPVVVNSAGKVVPLFGSWYSTKSDPLMPRINTLDVLGGSVTTTLTLDDLTLKSITSFRGISQNQSDDSEGGDTNPPFPKGHPENSSQIIQNASTFTQEFQATGGLLGDRLTYVGGLFYLYSHDTPEIIQPYASKQWGTNETTSSFAVYLNGTYRILDNWNFTAGIRGTWDSKTVRQEETTSAGFLYNLGDASDSWKAATYSIGTDYHITDDIMAYASYNTGFKAGEVSSVQNTKVAQADTFVPPETDRDLEVGFKTSWFDKRLVANLNYFYIPYKNLTTALVNNTTGEQFLAASDARMQGVELQVTARPTPQWNISGIVGTNFSKYVDTVPGGVGFGLADESLQHTPRLSTHWWTDYTFDDLPVVKGSLTLGADFQYTSKTFESASHAVYTTQNDYEILGFTATYLFENPRYSLILQGTNVTNTVYFLLGSSNFTHFVEPPAEYTLTLKYRM